jgi:dienelactone hydrolase
MGSNLTGFSGGGHFALALVFAAVASLATAAAVWCGGKDLRSVATWAGTAVLFALLTLFQMVFVLARLIERIKCK